MASLQQQRSSGALLSLSTVACWVVNDSRRPTRPGAIFEQHALGPRTGRSLDRGEIPTSPLGQKMLRGRVVDDFGLGVEPGIAVAPADNTDRQTTPGRLHAVAEAGQSAAASGERLLALCVDLVGSLAYETSQ